jgi:hypothetical protein
MKRSVRLPSPAMLVALAALFVSLGGVSYGFASGSIDSREVKDNSLRSKDLRNNDVRSIDIRNNEIRGRDIRNSTIRTEDIGANQVKGPDVLESSLGLVPRAGVANSANAAGSLNSQEKIGYQAGVSSGAQTIYDSGKLKLTASCSVAPQPTVTASTTVANATLHSTGGTGGANDTSPFTANVILTNATSEERTVVYSEPGGQVVVVHYAAVGGNPYGTTGCIVKGLAEKL